MAHGFRPSDKWRKFLDAQSGLLGRQATAALGRRTHQNPNIIWPEGSCDGAHFANIAVGATAAQHRVGGVRRQPAKPLFESVPVSHQALKEIMMPLAYISCSWLDVRLTELTYYSWYFKNHTSTKEIFVEGKMKSYQSARPHLLTWG